MVGEDATLADFAHEFPVVGAACIKQECPSHHTQHSPKTIAAKNTFGLILGFYSIHLSGYFLQAGSLEQPNPLVWGKRFYTRANILLCLGNHLGWRRDLQPGRLVQTNVSAGFGDTGIFIDRFLFIFWEGCDRFGDDGIE
jgi:hypothetical protein